MVIKYVPRIKSSEKILAKVKDPVKKIYHLFNIHYKSSAFQHHEANLIGLLDIIAGLEYHFKNHSKIEKMARNGKYYGHATHEAIAYLNRVGQLYYLFISKWFTNLVPLEKVHAHVPSIFALQPIRNKIGVHRQQDYPFNDDCKSLGFNSHKLFPSLFYRLEQQNYEPENPSEDLAKLLPNCKIKYSFPTKQRDKFFSHTHPEPVEGIEHIGSTNNLVIFIPTDHHQKILSEVFDLIRFFLLQQGK